MLKDDSKKIKIFSLERLRRAMLLKKKEKTSNIKVNAIFNAIYQVLILIVPLITTPYISTIFASSSSMFWVENSMDANSLLKLS